MARGRQPQPAAAIRRNQAPPPATHTKSNTRVSFTPSEDSLSSLLSRGSPASTDGPEPTPAPASPASTDELFKLFMQTYIDTVKNQALVQAPV